VFDPAVNATLDIVLQKQILEDGADLGEPSVGRLPPLLDLLLQGKNQGRIVLDLDK